MHRQRVFLLHWNLLKWEAGLPCSSPGRVLHAPASQSPFNMTVSKVSSSAQFCKLWEVWLSGFHMAAEEEENMCWNCHRFKLTFALGVLHTGGEAAEGVEHTHFSRYWIACIITFLHICLKFAERNLTRQVFRIHWVCFMIFFPTSFRRYGYLFALPHKHLISLYKCQPEWMVSLYVVSGSLTNDTILKWGKETTIRITVLPGNCLVPSDLWSLPTVKSSLIEPNSLWTQGWSWVSMQLSHKLYSIL